MLVSSTEPAPLRKLGRSSKKPEEYGADFLIPSTFGLVGVQRKEISDLIASLHDGRIAREFAQLKQCDLGIVVIEGTPSWTTDGYLLGRTSFTQAQMHGVLLSIQSQGLWLLQTTGLDSTARLLVNLQTWLSKERHSGFNGRPKATGTWGKPNSREFGVHWWQTWDGIGPTTAGNLYDAFGIPMAWTVTEAQLQEVKGVGKIRARKMMEAIGADRH